MAFLGLKNDTKSGAVRLLLLLLLTIQHYSFHFIFVLLFVTLINYILHKDHEKKNHIFLLLFIKHVQIPFY